MPAFWTHYLYGIDLYHTIPETSIKSKIKQYSGVYLLGLQGPDIFFYHLKSMAGPKNRNIGSLMHETRTHDFFHHYLTNMKQATSKHLYDVLYTYLCGLLGHYTLDASIHPYVYSRIQYAPYSDLPSNYSFGDHGELESVMDLLYLKKYNRTPSTVFPSKTIYMNLPDLKILGRHMANTINQTYFKTGSYHINPLDFYYAFFSTKLSTSLLHSKHGRRKQILLYLEQHVLHYNLIATTIPTDSMPDRFDALNVKKTTWNNPWDTSIRSDASVPELYDNAKKHFLSIMKELNPIYTKRNSNQTDHLEETIGNLSYHSGLASFDHF